MSRTLLVCRSCSEQPTFIHNMLTTIIKNYFIHNFTLISLSIQTWYLNCIGIVFWSKVKITTEWPYKITTGVYLNKYENIYPLTKNLSSRGLQLFIFLRTFLGWLPVEAAAPKILFIDDKYIFCLSVHASDVHRQAHQSNGVQLDATLNQRIHLILFI